MQQASESGCHLQHVGFVVEDLTRAAAHFAATYGVGPFLTVPHLEFDRLRYRGEPCVWDHSMAFAQWGDAQIELQQAHRTDPPELTELIGRPANSHLSYRVPDLDRETARLRAQGLDWFCEAQVGPVQFRFFRDPFLPSYIEVHQDNPFLAQFDASIAEATDRWDGAEPLMTLQTPPRG